MAKVESTCYSFRPLEVEFLVPTLRAHSQSPETSAPDLMTLQAPEDTCTYRHV